MRDILFDYSSFRLLSPPDHIIITLRLCELSAAFLNFSSPSSSRFFFSSSSLGFGGLGFGEHRCSTKCGKFWASCTTACLRGASPCFHKLSNGAGGGPVREEGEAFSVGSPVSAERAPSNVVSIGRTGDWEFRSSSRTFLSVIQDTSGSLVTKPFSLKPSTTGLLTSSLAG